MLDFQAFEGEVEVYASDTFYEPLPASIKDISIHLAGSDQRHDFCLGGRVLTERKVFNSQ